MESNTGQEGGALTSWTVAETDNLTIQAKREGGTLTAATEGRIDGANARLFLEALEGAIEDSDTAVLLDLSGLAYISSAGLRVILQTAKALRTQEAQFALCSAKGPIREVFEISGIDQIISIHDSEAAALASFEG